ncbi:unnamed protein product [Chironomus riparius]|uniref:Lipocalin/cytosolic fatty-acid binding domain-containing protein n=1 Tax=Chironomus riparius TaxID=315576 RepID=A0A9N9SBL6_9DIPT|nr:unnamed protein product [Chironomus riparius]
MKNLIISCLVAFCAADLYRKVPAEDNFEFDNFAGKWFELYYNNLNSQVECSVLNYSPNDQKYNFNVDGTYVFDDKYESSHQLHQLTFPKENPHRGLFNVTDHNNENKFSNFTYRVFSTDYSNYAIIWMCYELNSKLIEDIAIWGRKTNFSEELYIKIEMVLSKLNASLESFKKIDHSPEACLDW